MEQLSIRVKSISELLSELLGVGVTADIYRYRDDAHGNSIYMMHAIDRPNPAVTTYATIGLSDYPLMRGGEEFRTRVEFIAGCQKELAGVDNMVAELAFGIASGEYFSAPGVVVPGMLKKYGLSSTLTDAYFTRPFVWEDELSTQEIDGKPVSWLLVMAISEQESRYLREHGDVALGALLEQHDIDVFDWNRASVI